MRFDLLPPEYCYELFKLLNQVRPFGYDQVRAIVRDELGADPEHVFRSFDPAPFASASIGQVHRAVLPSGEAVAVKVQRPDVRQLLRTDIELMYALSVVLDRLGAFGATRSRDVVDEFARWTLDEIDYRTEARHAEALRANADGDPIEHNARVHWAYTTSRVLTMELLDGIPLIDVLYAVRDGNDAFLDRLRADGYDRAAIARHIDWNMFNQTYAHGLFHADLHPANLFVLPGNAIGYVDFGIVGTFSAPLRESMVRYSWLFFEGHADDATAELMRWVVPTGETSVDAARRELRRAHEEFFFDMRLGRATRETRGRGGASAFALQILSAVRENGMAVSPSVVAYLKVLATADALRQQLAPDYDLPREVQRYFRRYRAQRVRAWLDPRTATPQAFDFGLRLRGALDAVQADDRGRAGTDALALAVQTRVDVVRASIRRLALAALAALVTGLWLLGPRGGRAGELWQSLPPWAPAGLLGVAAALLLVILHQVRRLGAAARGVTPRGGARRLPARRWDPE
jgi:predicted unusual protein kinase regulating ubiquinone biosynthesis (AarF/ABC1/UbiB family)